MFRFYDIIHEKEGLQVMRGINLKLSYGTQIIYDDACFNIPAHSKVGIVGVNGAGKTTLFKVILGQLQLESGTIIKDDENIGYLPQEIDFAGLEMTVWDYLYSSRGIDDLKEQLTNTYMQLESVLLTTKKDC